MKYTTLFCLFLAFCPNVLLAQSVAQADELTAQGDLDAANKMYETLLKQASNDPEQALGLALKLANNYQQTQDYEKAVALLAQETAHWKSSTTADSLLGLAFHTLGICYYNLKDFSKAISHYEQAIKFRQRFSADYHIDMLKSMRNIGNAHLEMLNFQEAGKYYQKVIDLGNNKNAAIHKDFLANIFLEQGYVLTQSNDLEQAKNYISIGIELTEKYFKDDFYRLTHAYNRALLYYVEKEDGNKIIEYAQKSLKLYDAIPNEERYEEDDWEIANLYQNLGVGYVCLKNYQAAIKQYELANQINQQYEKKRTPYLADNYSNLANIYRITKDYPKALKNIESAIAYDSQGKKNLRLAFDYYIRGEIYFELGQFQQALADYQEAIKIYVPTFIPKSLFDCPSSKAELIGEKIGLTEILAGKARILYEYGQSKNDATLLQHALATYDTTAKFINLIRTGFQSDLSKSFIATKAKNVYEGALQVCNALYEKTKHVGYQKRAFEYIESSKSLVLLEAVKEGNAKKIAGIPDSLLSQELRWEQEVAALEKKIFQSEDEKQLTQLRINLVNAKRKLELLVQQLERENQAYYQLKYSTQSLDIQEVQQQLIPDAQTAFLEYFVGEQAIYVLVITKSQTQLITLKKDFPLNDWVVDLRRSYTNYHLMANQTASAYLENCKAISSLSFQIYTHIFAPIEAAFPLPEKLIIVPDGILGYIPFDALIKKESEDPTLHKQHQYLIKDYQISYVYSASLLQEMKARKTINKRGFFLGFAPTFDRTNSPITAFLPPRRNTAGNGILPPLKYNIPEVVQLQKLLGGKIIVGEKATVSTFEQQAPFYKIIHLATHGKANDEVGDYAYLAFTEVFDSLDNEKLYNRDLYHLNLNADMVVLSACETGIGELRLGEGIISLARGFSYAGAKSIITTLWSVDDQTTQKLMAQFYSYLKIGMPKDAALRQSKLDFLKNNSNLKAHPFYWATFIPIGDTQPIEQPSNFQIWVWMFVLVVAVGLIWYIWRKKHKLINT